jgi:hypothetical protein
MSRYLTIARSAIHANELNEKRPTSLHIESVTSYEINEINEVSPTTSSAVGPRVSRSDSLSTQHENSRLRLSREEATALGLNPEVLWVHVSRDEVEASAPPMHWKGTLPAGCRWARLCQTLGPCPRHLSHNACVREGETS